MVSSGCLVDIKTDADTKNQSFLYSSDLSFNNIEVIEGLDSLVKLQDLSLFNNRISVIENLDALRNLHILSFGNNAIAQLENVSQLYYDIFV